MKSYKFSNLLAYEKKIRDLYLKLGLNFDSSNRISKYFKYLNEIEEKRKLDKESFSQLIIKDRAKYYFSQFYVLEICNIIDAIENSDLDEKIVKGKLCDVSKGNYLLSEEDSDNTKARDTMFELSLLSFLKKNGLNARLCEPNPDIQLTSNNFIYNIECKRPQSSRSLERNIKKAMKQLKRTTKGNCVPTIALSLEQILLGQTLLEERKKSDLILDSKDEKAALAFLDTTLLNFLKNNNPLLGKILGNKPCLVLYYLSCLTGFKTNLPMADATFVTGNIFNFEGEISNSILNDLYSMFPPS
jgi:hypothetical protein